MTNRQNDQNRVQDVFQQGMQFMIQVPNDIAQRKDSELPHLEGNILNRKVQ